MSGPRQLPAVLVIVSSGVFATGVAALVEFGGEFAGGGFFLTNFFFFLPFLGSFELEPSRKFWKMSMRRSLGIAESKALRAISAESALLEVVGDSPSKGLSSTVRSVGVISEARGRFAAVAAALAWPADRVSISSRSPSAEKIAAGEGLGVRGAFEVIGIRGLGLIAGAQENASDLFGSFFFLPGFKSQPQKYFCLFNSGGIQKQLARFLYFYFYVSFF